VIGAAAGVYHPSSGNSNLVESNGAGITNKVGRAELAAVAAAFAHDHIHIATDSLTSLHQIRKQLLHPEKHHHHVQGDILMNGQTPLQNIKPATNSQLKKHRHRRPPGGNHFSDIN